MKTAPEEPSRKHKRGSGRDRVLDAYVEILLLDGVAAATMDEVARQAEISKGGLLHHFPSKDALVEGLLERLEEQTATDIANTLAQDSDVVTAYLRSSLSAADEFSATFMAALKLAGSNAPGVNEALVAHFEAWRSMLTEKIEDPVLAQLIHIVGDGLYLHALVGNQPNAAHEHLIEYLKKLTDGNNA